VYGSSPECINVKRQFSDINSRKRLKTTAAKAVDRPDDFGDTAALTLTIASQGNQLEINIRAEDQSQ